tara:strand:- start:266 stop:463 length:198 start_codon:yes stop_codon:yes gene_type:complete
MSDGYSKVEYDHLLPISICAVGDVPVASLRTGETFDAFPELFGARPALLIDCAMKFCINIPVKVF